MRRKWFDLKHAVLRISCKAFYERYDTSMNINDIVSNSSDKPSLDCEQPKTVLPREMPIGMLYVPYQQWRRVYEPAVGFERGTVYEELDKPFIGERS